MLPPVTYQGGKGRLAEQIVEKMNKLPILEVRMKKYVLWGLASIGVISLWIFSVVAFVFYCLGGH